MTRAINRIFSKSSEFGQSDVPSNTLLLIPSGLGTVFERLGTLEEQEIQYSQALAKSKARNNFAQQVIRSTYVQSDSHLSVQSAR